MFSISSVQAFAIIAAAQLVYGSPIAAATDKSVMLDRRATVDCGGGYRFLTAAQNKGYDDAIKHLDDGTTVTGNNGNPEYYGNQPAVDGIPAECTAADVMDLRIYPVFVQESTTFTDGSAPNQDRVVIARKPNQERVRCGLITHRGAASGQFKWCGI